MSVKNRYILSAADLKQFGKWLDAAQNAGTRYDGSEAADDALLAPLGDIDDFIRARNGGQSSETLEQEFARAVNPGLTDAFNIARFLDNTVDTFYASLKQKPTEQVIHTLVAGGAIVNHGDNARVFVKTDKQTPAFGTGNGDHRYEVKTDARLATLMERLKTLDIHADDVVIHTGGVDDNMMRTRPYMLVQIPKLDAEIGICDQIGEVTLMSNRIMGPTVWSHSTKDELKARDNVIAVPFRSEEQWWESLGGALQSQERHGSIKAKMFARKKEPLDLEMIRACIYEHRMVTGTWPSQDSGHIEHGPYAGHTTWSNINRNLNREGGRGLTGTSSLSKQCQIVSDTHSLDYKNHKDQEDLDIDLIRGTVLMHFVETKKWPTHTSEQIQYGAYANQETWSGIKNALYAGGRGLPGGSSLMQVKDELKAEIAAGTINLDDYKAGEGRNEDATPSDPSA